MASLSNSNDGGYLTSGYLISNAQCLYICQELNESCFGDHLGDDLDSSDLESSFHQRVDQHIKKYCNLGNSSSVSNSTSNFCLLYLNIRSLPCHWDELEFF